MMGNVPEMTSGLKDTVGVLREVLVKAIGSIVDNDKDAVLLDFPAYANAGDSAIWLGELALLRRYGQKINYVCDINTYSSETLKERVRGGTIFLSGGGNLGDLWPRHQDFREHIIGVFRHHDIVQLPQSVHFQHLSALRRASKIFRAHKNLAIMVRDEESMEIAIRHLSDNVRLCPDAAFAIADVPLRRNPTEEILWLARSDIESALPATAENAGLARHDWPVTTRSPWVLLGEYVRQQRGFRPRTEPISHRVLHYLYERMARARFLSGCRLLGRGSVVITDRLHGHILCLLLGIEHVLLDNSYGKIGRFHEKWTKGSNLSHWASTLEEAKTIAYSLLENQGKIRDVS